MITTRILIHLFLISSSLTALFVFSFPAFAQKKGLSNSHICRAAISTIFDKKPEIVNIKREQRFSGQDIVYISFEPEEGDKTTQFKCYINGKNIIWATETGAYRNTEIDSQIDYEVKNNVLTVRESHKNGSVFRKAFDIKKLIKQK